METSAQRKTMPVSALLDPKIVLPAIVSSFAKLNPRTLIKNPVMFVLEIVTALTTIILIRDLFAGLGPQHMFHAARRDRIDPDAVMGEIHGCGPRQIETGGLRRR